MVGISEFVRGTLAYLSNCGIAVLTLLAAALKLQPIRGALRCKARYDAQTTEIPDSRILLFIACGLLGTLLTHALSGWSETLGAITRTALGSNEPTQAVILTSTALYFTCEWSVARATSRAAVPGRRGRRNRQILRMVVAALLLQLAVAEPAAIWLLTRTASAHWSSITGLPPSLVGRLADIILTVCKVGLPLLPLIYLLIALSRLRRHVLVQGNPWPLRLLPLSLPVTALAAALLLWMIFPTSTPRLADLRCEVSPAPSGATLSVDAVFVNPGNQWWRPNWPLVINVEGSGETDPRTQETARFSGGGPTLDGEKGLGGFDPLLVAPREKAVMHRQIVLEEAPSSVTTCRLSNSFPTRSRDFFSIFFKRDDDWATRIDWKEVTPADDLEGIAEMMPADATPNVQGGFVRPKAPPIK